MAKKIEQKIEAIVAAINPETIEVYDNVALSIVQTGEKVYSVVSVEFNLATGKSGKVTVLHKDLDVYEAQHQFKIETVNNGLF